jgi:EAL and modified HD-GYP domain-containing signal transduction protein
MLNALRKLFAEKPADPPPAATEAAPQAPAATAVRSHSFVCRLPLIDGEERIAGYQFGLPERLQARLQGGAGFEVQRRAYDDALLHNLAALGAEGLLGSRLAFVRLATSASLDNPLIGRLPAANTVLMLPPPAMAAEVQAMGHRLGELHRHQLAHGWLFERSPEESMLPALAATADYAELAAGRFDGLEINTLLRGLAAAKPAGQAPMRFIAAGLASYDEYHLCAKGGFSYFAGPFVSNRDDWHPPKSDINRFHVIDLLNQVRAGAEFGVIARHLQQDPVLSFRMLRYLNSPAIGLLTPVNTLEKALIVLGRERFARWLSLFLFDIKSPGYRERLLTEQALARARFLESLAGHGRLPAQPHSLFMLGLFSLLDLLMGQSMPDLLRQARLPEPIQAALLGEAGACRDALDLAMATEGSAADAIETAAGRCGLDALEVSCTSIRALKWAHEVASLDAG